MATKLYECHIDLNRNEIQNAVEHNLSDFPSSPVEGQKFWHDVNKLSYIFNGTEWLVSSVQDSSTTVKGVVQLSNTYNGTSEVKATTEKALSDGLDTKQDLLGFTAEDVANKGQANGYVPLDSNSKINIGFIPAGAIEKLVKVADETARFALTTAQIQLWDSVLQLDTNVLYRVVDEANLDNADGYEAYTASVDWSVITSIPSDIYYKNTDTASDIINTPSGNIAATNVQSALNELDSDKVDKVTGKGLSTNDYDNTEKSKVADSFQKSSDTLDNITAGSTNLHYTSTIDARLADTSGENTGDETQATIKTKLGAATNADDGYLTKEDHALFSSGANGRYEFDFITTDFTANTIVIDETTHGLGTSIQLFLQITNSSGNEVICETGCNKTTGECYFSVNNVFNGTCVIRK